MHIRVEWYGTCLQFLKTGTMLPIRYIFMRCKVFYIQKITGALKFNFFLFANTFVLLQRTIANKKNLNLNLINIFVGPQNWKNWFCPWWGESNFFCFSVVFAFKQAKAQFGSGATLKMLSKLNLLAHFKVTGKIFRGFAPQK